MDAAEKKGVVAFKWEDAPKICRFNDEQYQWITSKINGPTGMIKDLMEFGVMIQSVMPGRGVPPDMKLHYHDFDSLFLVLQGGVVWCVEGVDYELGAGSFIYIPAGAVHEFIEVIGYTHVLAMVGEPLHGPSGVKLRSSETVISKVPWHEQFPEPRPRKVISTRNTCLYDGASHHAPYTSDKERMIITDESPIGAPF
ncbi:MAG: hypothetical protein BBJ60_12470 [Desulfobacterales bacterium S7086C20]|nr:MAG: hypothetical protein BBJ60_12470 [Desulfobacterales bacterium S7086C20]